MIRSSFSCRYSRTAFTAASATVDFCASAGTGKRAISIAIATIFKTILLFFAQCPAILSKLSEFSLYSTPPKKRKSGACSFVQVPCAEYANNFHRKVLSAAALEISKLIDVTEKEFARHVSPYFCSTASLCARFGPAARPRRRGHSAGHCHASFQSKSLASKRIRRRHCIRRRFFLNGFRRPSPRPRRLRPVLPPWPKHG